MRKRPLSVEGPHAKLIFNENWISGVSSRVSFDDATPQIYVLCAIDCLRSHLHLQKT